jgi:hypothetical protein
MRAIMSGMEPELTEEEIADLIDDRAEDDADAWEDE